MVSPLPPPAPTPPTGAMVPPTGDRTSNLLNLLKFSGAGGQPSQAQAQTFQQSQDSFQHFQQHQPQPPLQQQQQPQHPLQHHQQSHHQAQHQHQHQAGPAMQAPAPFPTQILAPAPSSQDPTGLLRALMSGSHENEEPKQHDAPPTATFGAASPPDETRTYLLNLLNRPKPSQNDQPLLNEGSRHGSFQQSNESPVDTSRHLHHVLENASQGQSSSHLSQHNQYETSDRHHYEQPAAGYGSYSFQPNQDGSIPVSRLFGNSYNNYEDHQTSSSQHHTPKSSNAAVPHAHSAGQSPAGPPFLILKKGDGSPTPPGAGRKNISHERSPLASPQSLRSQAVHSTVSPAGNAIGNPTPGSAASLASPGRADRNPETVSEAMHDLAETADQEAQEALARAEDEPDQSDYLKDLDDLDNARTEQEFEDIAQHAALAIKKELDRAENSGALEKIMSPEAALEVREIVEDAAAGHADHSNEAADGVADSWESADQDEIVVIEEEPAQPVKVYNFPMKPWISIQVNDNGDIERPQLRDEAIMDIARLKKEFDQIDRNLYTATERYMVYGMSKAGGLRVIRQEDGRDAKIFTDTKDRIFNVAMSCTAPDHDGAHRETIIGTGISGTVFWVQIRNGEKDHIEDANPEHVMYHAPTGMLIIGHPTRNSIYFAHLSAPKYNLKSVSQVDYIKRLIDHDTTIPQPDSTAVISGVREYSFANRGILRSLDLLSTPAMSQDSDEPTLFELYAMHSKGVACLLIKQAELGWSKDNKVLAPVSAVDAGVVSISKLKPPHALPAEPAHQELAPAPPAPARSNTKESTAHTAPSSQDETATRPAASSKKQESKDEDTPTPAAVKDEKPEKAERKGRKKKAAAVAAAAALAAESQSQSNGGSQSPRVTPKDSKSATAAVPAVPSSYVSMESIETVMNSLTTMESRLNSSFAGTINAAIKSLHTKLEDGQREREKDFDQHQKTLLTMISDVLNENTQKVLESLIQGQFDLAMPTISDVARKAVSEQFSSGTNRQLSQTIQKEINKSLPSATQHALQSTDFIKGLSDRVGSTVAANVQREVVHSLTNQMSTAFTAMATTACQQVADDLQRQHHAEMTALHEQRAADSKKIDELHTAFAQLTSMVSGMASTQEQFQTEFIRFQQQTTNNPGPLQQPIPAQQHQLPPAIQGQEYGPRHGQGPSQVHSQGLTQMQQQVQRMQEHMQQQQQQQQQQQGSQHYGSMQSPEASQHRSVGYQQSQTSSHGHGQHGAPYQQSHANSQALTLANESQGEEEFDQELADCVARIDGLIKAGRTEDALLRWLQSGREQFIFDRLMSKYSPQLVLDGMPGLLLLTIATTICQSLDSVTRERVAWLEVVVHKISTDFDNMEADARAITPKIFHLIITNTENLFVRISSTRGNDPILKNLSQMMGVAKRTLETHSTRHYG
ncbi:hypothetical protein BN1708_003914 [Verticillium longisporum]|uniref:Uncharacterized protein n=1 Tax=Verticillium longisporum TaxID=100787 RepID=A0A0G4LRX5_VERLO|nr:hypothetical protein BN1708_003914 [Verticillium longisporum]